MRPIMFFQAFVSIVFGTALIFLIHQADSRIAELSSVARLAAQSLQELKQANETLTEILVELKAREATTGAGQ